MTRQRLLLVYIVLCEIVRFIYCVNLTPEKIISRWFKKKKNGLHLKNHFKYKIEVIALSRLAMISFSPPLGRRGVNGRRLSLSLLSRISRTTIYSAPADLACRKNERLFRSRRRRALEATESYYVTLSLSLLQALYTRVYI